MTPTADDSPPDRTRRFTNPYAKGNFRVVVVGLAFVLGLVMVFGGSLSQRLTVVLCVCVLTLLARWVSPATWVDVDSRGLQFAWLLRRQLVTSGNLYRVSVPKGGLWPAVSLWCRWRFPIAVPFGAFDDPAGLARDVQRLIDDAGIILDAASTKVLRKAMESKPRPPRRK